MLAAGTRSRPATSAAAPAERSPGKEASKTDREDPSHPPQWKQPRRGFFPSVGNLSRRVSVKGTLVS